MEDKQLANSILEIIFKRRKLINSANQVGFLDLPNEEIEFHLEKIKRMISLEQPIIMILPAYPGKSPNRDKTLSKLPDLAEKHSIDNLNELCEEINELYIHGAKISICSDGYVFSDLVRIPDQDVYKYTEAIKHYYQEHYPNNFEFFDIKDSFTELDCFDAMREELMVRYGESLVSLMNKVKTEKETLSMYKGITKFLNEDFSGIKEFKNKSKTQIQKTSKQVSLRVIQRSNAWGDLLAEFYPESIRLSIHPQFNISKKIGINIAATDDNWRTPWHSVAIKRDNSIFLQKRSTVNEDTHRLMFCNGNPCHYKTVLTTLQVTS
jgi:pyoverdine/dityrosine biosynthesis protein Dit1